MASALTGAVRLPAGISAPNLRPRNARSMVQRTPVWRQKSSRQFVPIRAQQQAMQTSSGAAPGAPGPLPKATKTADSPTASSGQLPHPEGLHGAPLRGSASPLGATLVDGSPGSVNFALHSNGATGVSLCLFTEEDLKAGKSTVEVELSPELNRTAGVWHVQVPGLSPDLMYAYRLAGPAHIHHDDENEGHSYDSTRVLVDPYATEVISRSDYGVPAPDIGYEPTVNAAGEEVPSDKLGYGPCWPQAAGALPLEAAPFDWEGDAPINRPLDELVIYEAHVRGMTKHESSGSDAPGTYRGLIGKLDHLQEMGINALELLPVNEFNELEYYAVNEATGEYRFNYWGYSTVSFMAPMARYSHDVLQASGPGKAHAATREFKELVKACHKRGIEVILDVVFNHTAEGNEMGPHLSFRGVDNQVYYMLAPGGEYYNYSGCGNTFNCNHPVVAKFIVDCLKYWVEEMHVDGFRFDLASILTRAHSQWNEEVTEADGTTWTRTGIKYNEENAKFMTDGEQITGTPMADPPVVRMIVEEPALANTKLIAEAWDCEGLNQVGAFPHYGKWAEWNGGFRDSARNFIKGTDASIGAFSSALLGSPEMYRAHDAPEDSWWGNNTGKQWRGDRPPYHSVNFITAHDGFTLHDLVSYNDKHNDHNGENNNDGEEHNLSWNCGVEGNAEHDGGVMRLRERQMKNLMAALFVAQGVPMVHMGDEYGHTKGGNNNTYCHDNALNWFDWEGLEKNRDFFRFVKSMAHLRHTRPHMRATSYLDGDRVQWHGHVPHEPDWSDTSRLIAYTLGDALGGAMYIAFNSSHEPANVKLPVFGEDKPWQLLVDTSKPAPFDVLVDDGAATPEVLAVGREQANAWLAEGLYPMMPRSCIILECIAPPPPPPTPAAAAAAAATPGAAPAPAAPAAPAEAAAPAPAPAPAAAAAPPPPAPAAAAPAAASAEDPAVGGEFADVLRESGLQGEELLSLREALEENARLKRELGL